MRTDNEPLYELEEDEPLYVLHDEPEESVDETYIESEYPDDEDDEDDASDADIRDTGTAAKERAKKVLKSPVAILMKILMTPVEGWKALKRSKITPEKFAAGSFFPLVAVAAMSGFADLFYEGDVALSEVLMQALITFISFLFGYFSITPVSQLLLPRNARDVVKKPVSKLYALAGISSLALFYAVYTLLPMFGPALVFLPIWTIYILFRGIRILRVPADHETHVVVAYCLMVIGLPALWGWLLTEILPGV